MSTQCDTVRQPENLPLTQKRSPSTVQSAMYHFAGSSQGYCSLQIYHSL
ncbi:MAG: hypothetical protein RMY34_21420 [Aulosira sp. DedQUE10]|nr:hypothetical protein [Aulosira sp. DedQUE10]